MPLHLLVRLATHLLFGATAVKLLLNRSVPSAWRGFCLVEPPFQPLRRSSSPPHALESRRQALYRLGGPLAAVARPFAPTAVFTVVPYTESLFCAAAFWAWERLVSDRLAGYHHCSRHLRARYG